MKLKNNYANGTLLARLSLMVFIAMAGICNAVAESKIYVDDFTILPGEEKVIAVNFDNGDEIASLQMDFTLPEGLSYVSYKYNADRIERGVHSVYVDAQQGNEKKYRITIFHNVLEPIPGNGELVYLTLKADETFTSQGKILFDEIHLSDLSANRTDLDQFNVLASPEVGHVTTSETSFSIKQDGTHAVDLIMSNTVGIYGISGRITLPEGMTFGKNDRGRIAINYGERLPQDAVVNINEATGKFTISNSIEEFGYEGVLFSVNVVASEGLAETSSIVIGEVEVADKNNVNYNIEDVITIDVTNSYLADYVPAMKIANDLQTKLDDAIATIAETAPDVKDTEEITGAESAIQSQIDDLKAAIESAYDDETLGGNKETILAPATEIEAAIDQLLADAATAQKAFEDEQAKIAANEAAYTRLTEKIAALQAKLDEAKATIDEECSDVAADFTTAEEAIQGQIDALTEQVKTAYEAVELTEESNIDAETAEIEAAIDQLLADAATAQKAFEDEQTKIAANEAAYTRLTEEIAALQAKLDEAKATIGEECSDVAADFTTAEEAIQGQIDALTEQVKTAYEAVELTEESNIDAEAVEVEAAIEQLLVDAAAAQKEFEETSGIGILGISADKNVEIYTISGKRVSSPVKGNVYVIKYSDGSVKKVYLK